MAWIRPRARKDLGHLQIELAIADQHIHKRRKRKVILIETELFKNILCLPHKHKNMDLLKQHKENEAKMHEGLYFNLSLLAEFYPTTKEFNAVFRRDMFVKNNKAAFFEVIHYLLNILNPELTKKHLVSWPPYDLKKEAKFRSELITYLNTLNSMYEDGDIPLCQASSLISPGGFKFGKFMFKISQLVVYQHLKKSDKYSLLYHLKPHKNLRSVTNAQIHHLDNQTKLIEMKTKQMFYEYEKYYLNRNEKAREMEKGLETLDKNIFNGKKELEEIQKEFDSKYPAYPSLSCLEERLVDLKQSLDKVLELDKLFCSCEKLLRYLSSSTMILEHHEEDFIVPNDVAHIITNRKELNLCEFFQGVAVLLEKKSPQLQSPTATCIEQTKEILESISVKKQKMLQRLQFEQERINNILDDLRIHFMEKIGIKVDLDSLHVF